MKKVTALLLTFVFMLNLAACDTTENNSTLSEITKNATTITTPEQSSSHTKTDSEDSKPEKNTTEPNTSESEKTQPVENKENVTDDPATTINEQIIVDQDGIKITAIEYVYDQIWGEGIKLLIENNTDVNIRVRCNTVIVNNYMFSGLFSEVVASGKKSNAKLYLYSSELKSSGITNVGKIEMYFTVLNSDTYKTIFEPDVVTVQTSKFNNMDIKPNDDGLELYNENGIRIVGKFVDSDSIWGTSILLYLENSTDKNIRVSCENISVNGYMVTGYLYCDIYAGKMAIDTIDIFSSDLEENNIESIEDIELSFHIINTNNYQTIVDTDPIGFSLN